MKNIRDWLKIQPFFQNDFGDPLGPKGKCPYITLNGEDIADSQIIIEHLNKVYNVDLDKDLSETEKSIGHAIRIMAENHLYWYDSDSLNWKYLSLELLFHFSKLSFRGSKSLQFVNFITVANTSQ